MRCSILETCTVPLLIPILFLISSIRGAAIPPSARLSEVQWNDYSYREPMGEGTYAFGYDIEDAETSNVQYRNEERHANGSVTGSYGYLMPDGNVMTVHYIADKDGYRATVKITPRGNIKPIQLGVPENVLFDFSSNLPANPSRNVRAVALTSQPTINVQLPHNIPSYISAHLDKKNILGNLSDLQRSVLLQNAFGVTSTNIVNDEIQTYHNVPKND